METRKQGFSGIRSILNCKVVTVLCLLLLLLIALPLDIYIFQWRHEAQLPTAPVASSLIFGTNVGLFNAQDSFLTQSSVRNLVKKMHISTIRIPVRETPDNAQPALWSQALQYAKDLGLIPLLILPSASINTSGTSTSGGASTSSVNSNSNREIGNTNSTDINNDNVIAEDEQILKTVNNIMGKQRVFYELGNEEDLSYGIDQYQYTARWNKIVSALKQLAANAWFGGPVNYQSNAPYIAYFEHYAHPKPDFISWHTYFCSPQSSTQTCIANVAHLGVDITNTRNIIQASGDSVPPIFITEWNYDATQGANSDPRDTPQFQQQFVQTVLREFTKDGVYAAYHYVLNSNPAFNLVDTNNTTLTPAGQEFPIMYKQLMAMRLKRCSASFLFWKVGDCSGLPD
jgi:Glycosyl hydrolase catalytic core